MSKIIKHIEKADPQIGQTVSWFVFDFDGRTYTRTEITGTVIKVNSVNVQVKDKDGNVWKVSKELV